MNLKNLIIIIIAAFLSSFQTNGRDIDYNIETGISFESSGKLLALTSDGENSTYAIRLLKENRKSITLSASCYNKDLERTNHQSGDVTLPSETGLLKVLSTDDHFLILFASKNKVAGERTIYFMQVLKTTLDLTQQIKHLTTFTDSKRSGSKDSIWAVACENCNYFAIGHNKTPKSGKQVVEYSIFTSKMVPYSGGQLTLSTKNISRINGIHLDSKANLHIVQHEFRQLSTGKLASLVLNLYTLLPNGKVVLNHPDLNGYNISNSKFLETQDNSKLIIASTISMQGKTGVAGINLTTVDTETGKLIESNNGRLNRQIYEEAIAHDRSPHNNLNFLDSYILTDVLLTDDNEVVFVSKHVYNKQVIVYGEFGGQELSVARSRNLLVLKTDLNAKINWHQNILKEDYGTYSEMIKSDLLSFNGTDLCFLFPSEKYMKLDGDRNARRHRAERKTDCHEFVMVSLHEDVSRTTEEVWIHRGFTDTNDKLEVSSNTAIVFCSGNGSEALARIQLGD